MKYSILKLDKKNITDFAKERNLLLKTAKSEWVIFIDTDETIPAKLKKELEELGPKDFNGFYIMRKIVFLGRDIGWDKVLRLGKKNAGRWERKVHETWKIKGKIGILKNYLIHNTAASLKEYVKKMNNYSDIHAAENKKEGKKSSIFKIIFYPKLKFLQNLFLGRGVVFSIMQSFHSFLGWTKLWELQRK